jgi:Fe-S cluster assembly protein SufD
MVVRGFFHEIVRRIGIPDLEDRLDAALDSELSA